MSDGGREWQDRLRDIGERVVQASAFERLLISLAALLASFIVGAIVIVVSGFVVTCSEPVLSVAGHTLCYNPVDVFYQLFIRALVDPFNLSVTLAQTTLLALTGVSVAIAFKAGLFNIGGQGQLVLGGLAAAQAIVWVAPFAPGGLAGSFVLIPFGLIVAAIVGGIWAIIPGLLLAYREANEVITTIMLNFIAIGIAFVVVKAVLKPDTTQSVRTATLPDNAIMAPIVFMQSADFSIIGLGLAVLLIGAIYYLLTQRSLGFDIQASGIQPRAAEYAGVNSKVVTVVTMGISGAIAGVAGAVYVMMITSFWRTGVPSIGFDGITVSILAGNNPLGVLPAALLFGTMKSGSQLIDFTLGVPRQLVGVLRALVILFVAMPEFFRMGAHRFGWFTEERGE